MNRWSSKEFALDLFERTASTFLAALLGVITLTSTTRVDWSNGKAMWAILGVPTAVTLVKGLLANMANPESGASLLPSPPGPEVPPEPNGRLWDHRGAVDVVTVLVVVVLVILVLVLFGFLR